MSIIRDLSIKKKLRLVVMLTTGIALLLACVALAAYDFVMHRGEMVRDLSTAAEVIGTNSSAALTFDDPDSASEVLAALKAEPNIIYACLYKADSAPFAVYVRGGADDKFSPPAIREDGHYFENDSLRLFRQVSLNYEKIGTLFIESDLAEQSARLIGYAKTLGITLLASLLVAYLLTSKLQHLLTRPIMHLAKTAKTVSLENNYSLRAAKHGRDELGYLIDRFNEMLAQIEAQDERLRRSRDFYLQLFDGFPTLIWRAGVDGTCNYVNKNWSDLTGMSLGQAMGDGWIEALHPEDRDRCMQTYLAAFEARKPVEIEYRLRHRDGQYHYILDIGRPFHDLDGAFSGYIGSCYDITERKRAEDSLREREQWFKEIFEGSRDAIFLVGAEAQFIEVNQAACELTGYSRRELLSMKVPDLHEEGDLRAFHRYFDSIMNGKDVTSEAFILRKDGGKVPVEFSNRGIIFKSDPVMHTVARDISERRLAEEALRRSEERSRALIDAIPDAIMRMSREGIYLDVALPKDFPVQAKATDLVGKSAHDVLSPDVAREAMQNIERALQTGEMQSIEFKVSVDGQVRNREARIVRCGEDEIISITRDITERKRMEEALRQSEERYRTIIEEMADSFWEMDIAGHFTFFNNRVMIEQRRSREELLALNASTNRQHLDEENLQKIFQVLRQIYLTGETARGTVHEMIRGDRTRYSVESNISLIRDAEGKPIGFRGISRDVTKRIQAEKEMQKAKEAAEAANRAKSEFLANMSHEIRTPMNGIIGMTELALDTELTAEQREYLNLVRTSADSLLGIINDILDFSKIEAGKLDLDSSDFNIHDCVGDAMKTLAVRAHEKGLEIAYCVSPDVPETLAGDAGRLRQVIVNLIGNAIKFTHEGEVTALVEKIAQTGDEVSLHITVKDTGIGIPAGKLKLIFEPFVQGDGSATRKYGGTGLGLAISSQLVEMMGGRIWAESEIGKGTAFHFTARFGVSKESVKKSAPVGKSNLSGLRVLIVDDNATNRLLLERVVSNWEMVPTAVGSGQEAIDEIGRAAQASTPFNLVLLDANMTETDGFTVARQIKQREGLSDATIMMLSSASGLNETARCRKEGVAVYLVKPIKPSELSNAIEAVLGGEPYEQIESVRAKQQRTAQSEQHLRILLAEDSAVNRELVMRMLEKRGHLVWAAENGLMTLELMEKERFDIVLMDVQMPEMDGFEATAAIRQRERATGAHVPIIALTAHALKRDRERCLDAGMDGYLPKPIRAGELFQAIESFAPNSPSDEASETGSDTAMEELTQQAHEHPAFDQAALLARVDGDLELLRMLIDLFFDESPKLLSEIEEAVEQGEAQKLERSAHKLKGAVSNFQAKAAFDAALRLEMLGREGNMAQARDGFESLRKEIARLTTALGALAACEPALASD